MAAVISTASAFIPTTACSPAGPSTAFLGSSAKLAALALSKPSTTSRFSHQLAARCLQSQPQLPVVPREQRWMFEESEINGPDIWNKTWYPKASDHVSTEKTWYIVDATDKILGRLASTIAIHIRGKNLATYTPSVDMGAYVVVVYILH